jgi:IrrE N-terminal-like domain
MTDHGRKPFRWANDLNRLAAAALGQQRFPLPLELIATDYSRQVFPQSPIVSIEGGSLGAFEGALYPVTSGWAIIYNSDVSEGRKRFTIAHEFGHYLMHRPLFPKGIECSEESVTFRGGTDLESEADTFAVSLLMPLDDFRARLPANAVPTLDDLGTLAVHYGVSLIACILRWLEYTERRALIVISRDDFVLWSRSSEPALKTRLYMRTRNASPIEVPKNSLIRRKDLADIARDGIKHPPEVWFNEDCTELTIHSDRYDQVLSVLLFGSAPPRGFLDTEAEEDTFDRFGPRARGRFGD